jgi:hypothetical protein
MMLQVLVSAGPEVRSEGEERDRAPSPLIAGSVLASLDCPPVLLMLTRTAVPVTRLAAKVSAHRR